ncbi:MAG: hypothetical protein ACR2KB_11215 [Chitinophagaceae bacterium]
MKNIILLTSVFSFILLFQSCSLPKINSKQQPNVSKEADHRLATLNGKGDVNRSELTYDFLIAGDKDTIVHFNHFAIPVNAAYPSNFFEGRLTLHDLKIAGQFKEIKDCYNYTDSTDVDRKHLPQFDYEFVQSGSHIIPLKRGYLENEHPVWEYILEPGRVWDEKKDNGFSRVAIPFTLKKKNQNCLHNGVLMFLFKNDGSTSSLTYQFASETCAYFKFDMWGTVKSSYIPYKINSKGKYIQGYVAEVTGRMPTRPISELSKDYPGAQPNQFNAPNEITQEHMTFYGFVIDSINYVGGCETRYGTYPFCEVLNVPSYSTAKSISAGMGLMRMEKLYPGSRKMIVGDLIPSCASNSNWSDVTIENAVDMTTGNYKVLNPMVDEGARHINRFFSSLDHDGKIEYSCSIFPRKSTPGTQWIYHTSDTYIAGTAMNAHLRNLTGNPKADYFTDLIVKDIFKPLGTSPTSQIQQRTYDSAAQPFSGFGLFFQHDDVAKIGQFLISGAKINNQQMFDDNMYSRIINANMETGVKSNRGDSRYDNGFWLRDLKDWGICNDDYLIPAMEGYGGIKIFLLPNNTVYYFFSDNYQYAGKDGIIEANKIRPFCKSKE